MSAVRDPIRIRNVICEMTMEKRSLVDIDWPITRLPVFHIFGPLPNGTHACLHVHGVLPYIVLRVGGAYSDRIGDAMEKKISTMIRRELEKDGQQIKEERSYVARIEHVMGRSIYGYHETEEDFVKVFFSSPFYSTKATAALSSYSSPLLQPFEAHTPSMLQFFIDYSIFGMDFIHAQNCKYRIRPTRNMDDVLLGNLKVSDVVADLSLLSRLEPQCSCSVEMDVLATDIINATSQAHNVFSSNPGLEYMWAEEAKRGSAMVDTFSKCCAEKRPSNVYPTEKEFFRTLRRSLRNAAEAAGQSIDTQMNETIRQSEDEVLQIWTQREEEEVDMDETLRPDGERRIEEEESRDEARDEDDISEDENEDMEQTFYEIQEKISEQFEQVESSCRYTPTPRPRSATPYDDRPDDLTRERASQRQQQDIEDCAERWTTFGDGLLLHGERVEEAAARSRPPSRDLNEEKSFYNMFDTTSSHADSSSLFHRETPEEPEEEAAGEIRFLSVLSLELATITTTPMPDSAVDMIIAVSLHFCVDVCVSLDASRVLSFLVHDGPPLRQSLSVGEIRYFSDETSMLMALVETVNEMDPDMLIGYDTRGLSWGYLFDRAEFLGIPFFYNICRYPIEVSPTRRSSPSGRLVLTVWRIIRKEATLRAYDRAAATVSILKRTIPTFAQSTTAQWYLEGKKDNRLSVCHYLCLLSRNNLRLLWELTFFPKTSEMARVYGIQFEEVLSRGSQFRVESMLLRLARTQRLFAPSVTPLQRSRMCAPEQLQLVMEPRSGVYFDPVIVLDFQSLYPSMAIAYNYCYTSCVGKVSHTVDALASGQSDIEMGALSYSLPIPALASLSASRSLHVSPLGCSFVKGKEGLIPTMLREILAARFMVKLAAKTTKSKRRSRVLDARQLALKLVANVTYGYTAANWSGRMPCVEVADAILGKGRETLERAIQLVNQGDYMGARVIYGDTDSLFVLVEGATLHEAFAIGRRIVDDVTADNPAPVVLKLEKVYIGCVLQTKKRYAGFAFEDENGKGKLDAKGIETVRRDSCPLTAKVLERTLHLLFARRFSSLIRYLDIQLSSLRELPYTDFVFSKEFRGEYAPTAHVPQAKVAEERAAVCAQWAPDVRERVPYIVISGSEAATVFSCVRSIEEFLINRNEQINYSYYVNAHLLPALHRVLALLPLRVNWQPFPPTTCSSVGCPSSSSPWCSTCSSTTSALSRALLHTANLQRKRHQAKSNCIRCASTRSISECTSYACPFHRILETSRRDRTAMALTAHPLYPPPRELARRAQN